MTLHSQCEWEMENTCTSGCGTSSLWYSVLADQLQQHHWAVSASVKLTVIPFYGLRSQSGYRQSKIPERRHCRIKLSHLICSRSRALSSVICRSEALYCHRSGGGRRSHGFPLPRYQNDALTTRMGNCSSMRRWSMIRCSAGLTEPACRHVT
jgi:hypothetical protein